MYTAPRANDRSWYGETVTASKGMPAMAANRARRVPEARSSRGTTLWKRGMANCGKRTVSTPVTRSQRSALKKPASDWLAYQRATSAVKPKNSQWTARRPRRRTLSAMASASTAQKRMVLGLRSCTEDSVAPTGGARKVTGRSGGG